MPVIFVIYYLSYNLNIQGGEDIKWCHVIFFSIIRQIEHLLNESYLMVRVFLSIIDIFLVVFCSYRSHSKSNSFNTSPRYLINSAGGLGKDFNSRGNRYYSTNRGLEGNPKLGSKSKTLSSPKSRPYEDLYAGRGIPKNEPV